MFNVAVFFIDFIPFFPTLALLVFIISLLYYINLLILIILYYYTNLNIICLVVFSVVFGERGILLALVWMIPFPMRISWASLTIY